MHCCGRYRGPLPPCCGSRSPRSFALAPRSRNDPAKGGGGQWTRLASAPRSARRRAAHAAAALVARLPPGKPRASLAQSAVPGRTAWAAGIGQSPYGNPWLGSFGPLRLHGPTRWKREGLVGGSIFFLTPWGLGCRSFSRCSCLRPDEPLALSRSSWNQLPLSLPAVVDRRGDVAGPRFLQARADGAGAWLLRGSSDTCSAASGRVRLPTIRNAGSWELPVSPPLPFRVAGGRPGGPRKRAGGARRFTPSLSLRDRPGGLWERPGQGGGPSRMVEAAQGPAGPRIARSPRRDAPESPSPS